MQNKLLIISACQVEAIKQRVSTSNKEEWNRSVLGAAEQRAVERPWTFMYPGCQFLSGRMFAFIALHGHLIEEWEIGMLWEMHSEDVEALLSSHPCYILRSVIAGKGKSEKMEIKRDIWLLLLCWNNSIRHWKHNVVFSRMHPLILTSLIKDTHW